MARSNTEAKSRTARKVTSTSKRAAARKPRRQPASAKMPMQVPDRPGGKLGMIVDQLSRASGATADELAATTGWQKHTVLGALSRLRSRGFLMRRDPDGGHSRYRLERPD